MVLSIRILPSACQVNTQAEEVRGRPYDSRPCSIRHFHASENPGMGPPPCPHMNSRINHWNDGMGNEGTLPFDYAQGKL